MSIQPWVKMTRSFDQRWVEQVGYVLCIDGVLDGHGVEGALVGVSEEKLDELHIVAGDRVSGEANLVVYLDGDDAEYGEATVLRREGTEFEAPTDAPPYRTQPPALHVYEERGFRRLSSEAFEHTCWSCIWGCRMPVEMIIDQWKPSHREYRSEIFCYGPLSCDLYEAGPPREVPGRKRDMVFVEEDWVDQDATRHREDEE